MSSHIESNKIDENLKSIICDLEVRMIECESKFIEIGRKLLDSFSREKFNSKLLKNIELNAKLYHKLSFNKIELEDTHQIICSKIKIKKMIHIGIIKLISFFSDINIKDVKSILDIFIENKYSYQFRNKEICGLFANYFTDIDILKKVHDFIYEIGIEDMSINISICIIDYTLSDIFERINEYSENMIDEQMDKLKKILSNLNTLNYNSDMCAIVDYLHRHKQNNNKKEYKQLVDFITKLQNYIFYNLNLLNTVEYNEQFKKYL